MKKGGEEEKLSTSRRKEIIKAEVNESKKNSIKQVSDSFRKHQGK